MLPSFGRCTATSWLTKKIEFLRQIRAAGSDEGPNGVPASGRGLHGEHEERRGETSGPSRIRQMGEKHPNDASVMGGFLFFRYLQKERSELLDFRPVGDKWQIVRGWLRDRLED